GKISIKINILAAKAKVTLKYNLQYDKPIEVTTLHEIKKEIIYMFFDRQLDNYYALCFQLETVKMTAISFTTSLFEQSYYEEVHYNTIYKTFRRQFKLYDLIGTGFLLVYLILNTTKSFKNEQQQGLKTKALNSFFQSLYNEYYSICSSDLYETVVEIVKNHFNTHSKISVNINKQFLSPNEIRIKAVSEIYEFCTTNNLSIQWIYLWFS
ncbi:5556_t:CDS:2, partial [Cetraspora pellucida]